MAEVNAQKPLEQKPIETPQNPALHPAEVAQNKLLRDAIAQRQSDRDLLARIAEEHSRGENYTPLDPNRFGNLPLNEALAQAKHENAVLMNNVHTILDPERPAPMPPVQPRVEAPIAPPPAPKIEPQRGFWNSIKTGFGKLFGRR